MDRNVINQDIYFVKGVDTKTNPIFVKENMLSVENGEIYNESVIKSKGYVEAGSTEQTEDTTNQFVFTYNSNLYRIQSDTISLYRQSVDAFEDLSTLRTLVTESHKPSSNLATTTTQPLISAIYGDYYTYLVYNSDSEYWELTIFNLAKSVVEYRNTQYFSYSSVGVGDLPLEIVGTPSGVVVYYTPSTGVVSEDLISYESFQITTSSSIITNLYLYNSTTVPDYVKHYYPSLTAKYANGMLFILYRRGTETVCDATMLVRNLSGSSVFTNSSLVTAVNLQSDQGYRNMGTFALTTDSVPYVLFMFGLNFYVVSSLTYVEEVSKSFSYTTAPGYTPGDEIFQTFNVGIIPDTYEFVMVKHNPEQTYTTGTQVCPFINKYNFSTNTWSLYTNTCDSRYNDGNYFSVKGSCSLAGAVVGFGSLAYFPVAVFSYIEVDDGATITVSTPVNERRCTIYLVDSDYNVVEPLYSYDVTLYNYYNTTIGDYTDSYIPNVARVKINAIDNTDINIAYPFLINQTTNVFDDTYTYSRSVEVVDVSSIVPTTFFSTEANKSCYVGNSRLVELSGDVVSEQNWFDYPQIEVIEDATVGSLEVDGVYEYSAIYQWTNSKGEVVRSAQSIPKSITMTGSTSTKVYFTPPPFFSNKPGAYFLLYRSIDSNTTLHLVYSAKVSDIVAAGTFTYVDTDSDATIEQNEIIYTSGGVLSEFPFLTSKGWVECKSRVWSISRADPTIIYFSHPETANIALSTNPIFSVQMPVEGGDCVALGNLDEKLVVFKKDYIYVILGTPPNSLDQNSTLRGPTRINSPVGCSEPNSIVRTPVGIMFKSYKGIWLLDRSLSVQYIGSEVEAYNENTVTSASLLLRENKVKFTTLEGPVLVYDYYYKAWTVESDLYFTSSTVYDGSFVGLKLNGETYISDSSLYTRDGKTYNISVQTPWISANQTQAQFCIEKIQILGTYEGPHILKWSLYYDYSDTPQEQGYFTPNDVTGTANSYGMGSWGSLAEYGGTKTGEYIFRITPNRTACMSFSVKFEDVFENTRYETGNSFTLSHMRCSMAAIDNVYTIDSDRISG